METRAAKMTAVCKEGSHLLPLLETLEDSSSSPSEQTDAYLSLVSRLSGEDGKDLMVLVEGQFPRLCKLYKEHISNENSDLGNAALQALGFCVFNSKIASGLSASEIEELFLALNAIAAKGTDKNRCTRALWVISKQNFSSEAVGKAVPSILSTLESVLSREVQSFVIEYEALNVIIRLLEQAPTQMTDEAVRWAKLVIPLVIHSAPKVRLRSATVLEIGMPVLLKKHQEVAAITEQLMSSKIIAEMQKLFASKNETYVLKLWPLFVKLLGKTLHRSGTFINSLLQLEELGFRSGSPTVKKIAFIAWKSLIDNFALNPDILSSTKRLKLLMQPLSSIHVRTEALALTKIEVWWYLLMRLGAQLHLHFEQVCLPLIQSALSTESTTATPLKGSNHSTVASTPIQKGNNLFASPTTPKINLNSSLLSSVAFPSVHLIGVEMMLHFLLGPEIVKFASQHKLVLNLEPLQHPLISSSSFFCKHAAVLLTSVQDGFIVIGKDASGAVINAIWKDMIDFVKAAMDTGAKKERQGSEVLTYLLQSLKTIITSDFLQVEKSMSLLECTVKGLPQKVLGSAAYQVANMDLLNGTPALFIIQLHFHYKLLDHGITTERYFINLETLVKCVLSGSTSPLAFTEAVLAELNQCARVLENKEALWRMWSMLINPLTDRINQTNEVNQGDALEHNFNAMHSALMLPIAHIFSISEFPQPSMKTLMRTWSDLYKAFARCAALVTTTEENVCCEELCSRILLVFGECQSCLSFLERIVQVITVIVDCVNFSPYTTKFQPKTKAPHTPTDWAKRKKEPLGNLSSLLKVIMKSLDCFHTLTSESLPDASSPLLSIGGSLIGALSTCLSHITLPSLFRTVFVMLTKPISVFYETSKSESSKVYSSLGNKLDKLLADGLQSLSTRYTGSFDSELLTALSPLLCAVFIHKNKQIRNQVAQFWNGSFGKTAGLLYPEELKPVLSQIKSKTPLLLPGFTYSNSSEFSGPDSDNTDNSHLETKISGIEVKSAGKRDSLLARAEEINDKGTPIRSSQVKAKLDFSSPKRKLQLLEEEQSVEFVFIPPETKERVLTEHQKEVLRTKRVDIPTMYNNLDASQDTTLFSQYSQSQENSSEKTAVPEELEDVAKTKESVSDVLPAEKEICDVENLEADVEMVDAGQPTDITEESTVVDTEKSQNISNASNSSTSSDLVVGTPPPPTSRRQSFITLEKFDKSPNRSFSPMPDTKFPKATIVTLVPDSQEATDTECGLKNVISVNHKEPSNNDTPKSKRKRPNTTQIEVNCAKKQIPDEFNPDSATGSTTKTEPVEEELVDFIPDSQPQDQEPKTGDAAENAKVGSSASKNKAESKENTPPEPESNLQSEGSQSRPVNKVSLRRSSRRQSEILEGVSNENVGQKRDRTKSEEKPLKKGMQPKETSRLQQTEKAEKTQEEKELTKMDLSLQVSVAAEKNAEKTKTPEVKPSEDLPDSNSSKDSQEMTRSRPRYQTRRSLQALKTGAENSESDNSETRDEGGKRKRAARSKSKTADGSEKEEPSERSQPSTMESDSKTETESVKNPEPTLDVDLHVDHSDAVEDDKTYSITTENTCLTTKEFDSEPSLASEPLLCSTVENQTCDASKGDTKPPLCTEKENVTRDITKNDPEHSLSSNVENKTCDIAKNDPEPSLSISNLQNTYDVTNHSTVASTMMQSEMTEPSSCDFSTAVSDVFPKTESKLEESPDCPDKKTRRIRRSKSCDCCSEESPEQEKSVTGSPSSEGNSVKEKKTLPSISCSEASCANLHFDISVFSGPCAVSTPLDMKASGPCFFIERVAEVKTDTESDQEITVVPVSEGSSQTDVTQVQTKTVVDPELLSVEEQNSAGPVVSETSDALTVGIDIEMNDAQSVDADGEEPSASDLKDAADSCTTPAAATTLSAPNKTDEETEVDRSEDVPDETEAETLKSQDFAQDMEGENGKSQGFSHDMEGDLGKAEDAVPGTDSAVCSASGSDGLVAAENNKQLASDCPAVTTEKCADPTESNVTIERVAEGRADTDSPPKMKGLISLASANDSPSGYSGWSPSASPSTSILKKGLKRQQENDSPSPINKIRRVSFADPIYQEGLADDIDRRSPVIRGHSSNGSPSSRSLKMLTISQPKLNTTPTKGFLSPGSRALGCKSSKKNLISEMTKESMPSPKESVYPALMNCTTSIDVILPQITSNMWARGLGQLIRAKNIKTIGDLSTMTPSEIKTLPIRSPKISNVKKALRGYHDQQTKAKGYDEFAVLGEIEKPLNGIDEKTTSADEEKLATDLIEQPVAAIASTDTTAPLPDVPAQISALSVKLSTEDLNKYSGSQLFEMQEKLTLMSSCILKHLQSQWRSPPHPGSDQ